MMKRFRVVSLALAILAIVWTIGCDESRPPKRLYEPDPSAQAAEDPRPSLAAMLSAPRKTLQLKDFPLVIEVPESWRLTDSMLKGPTPHGPLPDGEINVRVSQLPLVPKSSIEKLAEAAKDEGEVKLLETHQQAPITILDKRVVQRAKDKDHSDMMNWQVMIYVDHDAEHATPYALSFLGLTDEQYEQDKPLLEQIVRSIRHTPAAAPAIPTIR